MKTNEGRGCAVVGRGRGARGPCRSERDRRRPRDRGPPALYVFSPCCLIFSGFNCFASCTSQHNAQFAKRRVSKSRACVLQVSASIKMRCCVRASKFQNLQRRIPHKFSQKSPSDVARLHRASGFGVDVARLHRRRTQRPGPSWKSKLRNFNGNLQSEQGVA